MASLESPTSVFSQNSPRTPSRDGSASPVLTPRSKVKAMLAAMEADDDDGDEEIYRPRGKLASRMMPTESDLTATKDNAYERVKQTLLARKIASPKKASEENSEMSVLGDDKDSDGGDDDDEIPIPSSRRRRINKSSPRASPSKPSSRTAESPRQRRSPRPQSVSPPPNDNEEEEESDDELPPQNLMANAKFMALVEKNRRARQEAEAERLEEEKRRQRRQLDAQLGCGSEDDEDGGAHMTQREPRRKAGKKALEEMHRESQRLARSMHLEHQVRTRKKITKQSLFDKFNFRTSTHPVIKEGTNKTKASPADSSSVNAGSETEHVPYSSPNSSPLSEVGKQAAKTASPEVGDRELTPSQWMDEDMPIDISKGKAQTTSERVEGEGILPLALNKGKGKVAETRPFVLDKGKGKAIEKSPPKVKLVLPPIKITVSKQPPKSGPDSDSDLEILQPGRGEKVANSERQKMVEQLRQVRRVKPLVETQRKQKLTAQELQVDLLKKSRLQAAQEREERVEELKAKGIIVLTAEERAREEKQVEDMLEKARREALAIRKGEKRNEKVQKGEILKKENATIESGDDEEDEDWLEEEDVVDISGEEDDEEIETEEEKEQGSEANKSHDFSDDQEKDAQDDTADDGIGSPGFVSLSSMYPPEGDLISLIPRLSEMPAAYIDAEADSDSDESNGDFAPLKSLKRKEQRRKLRVVEDDDEMEIEQEAIAPESRIPSIFRNKMAHPTLLGMTQLFDATGLPASADVNVGSDAVKEKADSLRKDPGDGIPNSQAHLDFGKEQILDLHYSQDGDRLTVDETSLPALDLHYEPSTQMSTFPDPTQDQGFTRSSSPAPPRFGLTQEEPSSPIVQIPNSQPTRKKRRLVRGGVNHEGEGEGDEKERQEQAAEKPTETAFDIMRKAAKKAKQFDNFDKSNSGAKEMVHEQAEESEDEYAGIGGASDEEGADGHDSDLEGMIDDENHEKVDEAAIAAFYAEKEIAQDEKDVSRLFKDLQTGMFRKKRGADFDLDDSDEDSDGDARRRAKRRQMAKLRKALMADSNIEKLASNPKKLAFLNAIEDRDRDDEMDFLDRGEEDLFIDLELLDSQSRSQSQSSREMSMDTGDGAGGDFGSRRSTGGSDGVITAPKSRRTNRSKKPSLAEVRETLSFLIEENDSQMTGLSDSDGEGTEVPILPKRRTTAVIDRVAAARANSSTSENARMAFQTTAEVQFRVPGLLRRGTTDLSSASGDSQGSSGNSTIGSNGSAQSESSVIKRGGKASSSINFHQREQLRAKVENNRELKRKQERKKQGQQRQSVLGILAKGTFS